MSRISPTDPSLLSQVTSSLATLHQEDEPRSTIRNCVYSSGILWACVIGWRRGGLMTWLIEEWMALGGGAKNSPGHGFSLEGACVLFSVSARRPQGAHGHAGKFLYTQWPPHAPL